LPDCEVSRGGEEEEAGGGHADTWVFSLVHGNGDEDWEDLSFNNFIGKLILASTVNSADLVNWDVQGRTGDNQALKGKNSLGLHVGIVFVIKNVLNNGDGFWDSEVSKGSQVGSSPVFVLLFIAFHILLYVLDKVVSILSLDVFLVTEFTVDGNWVAGVGNACIDTSLVQNVGKSKDSGGLDLILIALNGAGVSKLIDFLEHGWGWSSQVHWEGHDDLSGMLTSQFLLLDELDQEVDIWVGTSNGGTVKEDITGSLIFFSLALGSDLVV